MSKFQCITRKIANNKILTSPSRLDVTAAVHFSYCSPEPQFPTTSFRALFLCWCTHGEICYGHRHGNEMVNIKKRKERPCVVRFCSNSNSKPVRGHSRPTYTHCKVQNTMRGSSVAYGKRSAMQQLLHYARVNPGLYHRLWMRRQGESWRFKRRHPCH